MDRKTSKATTYSDLSNFIDLDYDSLRTSFDNCESRYLRRSLGGALNECLAEILCVRPADPIEYMGHWLYRYADIRNYFRKKKSFYEELLTTKMDMENKKMTLLQKHNEAILDITEPLVRENYEPSEAVNSSREQSVVLASGSKVLGSGSNNLFKLLDKEAHEQGKRKSSAASDKASFSTGGKRASRHSDSAGLTPADKRASIKGDKEALTPVDKRASIQGDKEALTPVDKAASTPKENKTRTENDISDNSSLDREGNSVYRRGISPVAKKPQDAKTVGDKGRQTKLQKFLTGHLAMTQLLKKVKAKYPNSEEESYDHRKPGEVLVNFNYFDDDTSKRESLEVQPARWSVCGNHIICHHPVLGIMSIQGRRYSQTFEQAIDVVDDFVAQNMYDPELYIHDLAPEEKSIPEGLEMSDLESMVNESEIRSVSIVNELYE